MTTTRKKIDTHRKLKSQHGRVDKRADQQLNDEWVHIENFNLPVQANWLNISDAYTYSEVNREVNTQEEQAITASNAINKFDEGTNIPDLIQMLASQLDKNELVAIFAEEFEYLANKIKTKLTKSRQNHDTRSKCYADKPKWSISRGLRDNKKEGPIEFIERIYGLTDNISLPELRSHDNPLYQALSRFAVKKGTTVGELPFIRTKSDIIEEESSLYDKIDYSNASYNEVRKLQARRKRPPPKKQ